MLFPSKPRCFNLFNIYVFFKIWINRSLISINIKNVCLFFSEIGAFTLKKYTYTFFILQNAKLNYLKCNLHPRDIFPQNVLKLTVSKFLPVYMINAVSKFLVPIIKYLIIKKFSIDYLSNVVHHAHMSKHMGRDYLIAIHLNPRSIEDPRSPTNSMASLLVKLPHFRDHHEKIPQRVRR